MLDLRCWRMAFWDMRRGGGMLVLLLRSKVIACEQCWKMLKLTRIEEGDTAFPSPAATHCKASVMRTRSGSKGPSS